ncbi:hypothetical protein SLOPH_1123 [Spraguea lophii 42_110]|uniref:Uncharacterized protein n=1 Tax=Spraguea lophii (strain 42_110) TaxID=1358809 RepID=S7WAL5_SPRLO|nr:hypothetical protein SLOPH_1123 [Spraguea lophii 42_110]
MPYTPRKRRLSALSASKSHKKDEEDTNIEFSTYVEEKTKVTNVDIEETKENISEINNNKEIFLKEQVVDIEKIENNVDDTLVQEEVEEINLSKKESTTKIQMNNNLTEKNIEIEKEEKETEKIHSMKENDILDKKETIENKYSLDPSILEKIRADHKERVAAIIDELGDKTTNEDEDEEEMECSMDQESISEEEIDEEEISKIQNTMQDIICNNPSAKEFLGSFLKNGNIVSTIDDIVKIKKQQKNEVIMEEKKIEVEKVEEQFSEDLENYKKEIKNLKIENQQNEIKIEELTENNNSLNEKMDNLNTTIDCADKTIIHLEEQIKILKNKVDIVVNKLETEKLKNKESSDVKEDVRDGKRILKQMGEEYEIEKQEMTKSIDELKNENKTMEIRLENMKGVVSELLKKINDQEDK